MSLEPVKPGIIAMVGGRDLPADLNPSVAESG